MGPVVCVRWVHRSWLRPLREARPAGPPVHLRQLCDHHFLLLSLPRLPAQLPRVSWSLHELTVWNTLVSTLLQFTLYDFFYHGFHRTLHLGSIYPYIHKHHHKQKAPTRGVMDGINVHPFEMAVGIYLHLFVVAVIPCHIVGAQLFFGMASLMAGFNHTRWGIYVPKFYDVRDHDMHHVYPNCNYAQYVMWWDKLFGCFKESPTSRPPLKKKI